MAHLASPSSLRTGKVSLWGSSNYAGKSVNNLQTGLSYLINSNLRQDDYCLVSSSSFVGSDGVLNSKVLFYPLVAPFTGSPFPVDRSFPTFLDTRQLADLSRSVPKRALGRMWVTRQLEYDNRLIGSEPRKRIRTWLTAAMFRGSTIPKKTPKFAFRKKPGVLSEARTMIDESERELDKVLEAKRAQRFKTSKRILRRDMRRVVRLSKLLYLHAENSPKAAAIRATLNKIIARHPIFRKPKERKPMRSYSDMFEKFRNILRVRKLYKFTRRSKLFRRGKLSKLKKLVAARGQEWGARRIRFSKFRVRSRFRRVRPNRTKREKLWSDLSTPLFHSASLSRYVSIRLGCRTRIRSINVFTYLKRKFKSLITYKSHQSHIWHSYHKYKWSIQSFYDLANSFFILSKIPQTEHLVISIIQVALVNMHRRKIKPKRLFTLIDRIIKEMPEIKESFHACRVVITGKIKGGTARTSTLSSGYGDFPKQSISENIRMNFGDVYSKYGSYGVKILTWRKTGV